MKQGNVDKAIDYYGNGAYLSYETNNIYAIPKALYNIALGFKEKGENEKAIYYTEQSIKMYEYIDNPKGLKKAKYLLSSI